MAAPALPRRPGHGQGPALATTRADTAWQADAAACRQALAQGSRTFLAASHLLPVAVRDPACVLYAFCRQADDAVDGQRDGQAAATPASAAAGAAAACAAVARLRERLARVYAGRPDARPADRALAGVVQRFEIPVALPEALLDGFAWDAEERRYDTLAEVQAYAARVAGSVGAMMALLMGARSAPALARACDLGVAMQLSNIARDVGDDARAQRLYLPRQWLREAGIDPEAWLAQPHHSPALAGVLRRLLREADALYARAGAGVALLPAACRPGINAARCLYAQIGLQVERNGLDAVAVRASVSAPRKLGTLLQAAAGALLLAPDAALAAQPPLPAVRHLVEAVAGPWAAGAPAPASAGGLAGVLAMVERLERRDRGLRPAR